MQLSKAFCLASWTIIASLSLCRSLVLVAFFFFLMHLGFLSLSLTLTDLFFTLCLFLSLYDHADSLTHSFSLSLTLSLSLSLSLPPSLCLSYINWQFECVSGLYQCQCGTCGYCAGLSLLLGTRLSLCDSVLIKTILPHASRANFIFQ